MDRAERAKEYFLQGYNCAQSVSLAFADRIGLPEELIARLAAGYGGGVGRLRETCGTVLGGVFVLNALYGGYPPEDRQAKAELYRKVQTLAREFAATNGSYLCRELLGIGENNDPVPEARTAEYYRKRPCAELAACSAEILEKILDKAEK